MAGASPVTLLRQAIAHLDQNRIDEAEALLGDVLAAKAEDPDALQLLGLVRRMQQRDAEAEELYRRSLAANPAQPHVQHNLGNLLRQIGRIDEAIAAEREAIALKSNYAEAFLGLGLALLNRGDRERPDGTADWMAAEKNIRRALHIRPVFTEARQALGVALNALGRSKEAEAIFRQMLSAGNLAPDQIAELEFNLGVAAAAQDRHEDALACYDAAEQKLPGIANVHYNRANALQNLGMMERAALSYREAIAQNPLDMRAHSDLNHLLHRLGNSADFLRSYDDAIAFYPDNAALHQAKASFLLLKDDLVQARTNFEQAVFLNPADFVAQDGLAQVLARQGDFGAAVAHHEAAARLRPETPGVWANFAETLLRSGDAGGAAARAQTARDLDPFHQGAVAMQATAFAAMGDGRAEALNDYGKLVRTFEIAPPSGYSNMQDFNRDLAVSLTALHRDRREMVDQTLRGGTQTAGHLFGKNRDLVERLRTSIEVAIVDYVRGLEDDENHPLFARKRRNFGYSGSWSSLLHDCGFHTNHYHGKGWISSAYYVSVPDAVAEGEQGWIKFGEPPFDVGPSGAARRAIRPENGLLVLFPSYMWHGTNPFRSPQERMTVAFDVIPKAG